ncbi:hypothetical protein [Nitrospirillum iridis]|uniref:Uncharacterized protein n=1 Tax=Nitrospirillum iridis TaxID=765888 RepID=A0A7X0B1V0_9PROT|nr:hypothetical protein [Nitrospirillum iridis]MBB6253150.1 hypothetical protein [Nitrospirillum iridis]
MPISLDFPEITDAFRQFLLMPVRQIAHSFEALSLWLQKRVKAADLLEAGSRGYPVLRFEGDAVSLWLDAQQARGLGPSEPAPGFAQRARDAGSRFVAGIGTIGQQISQDLILPAAFATFADAIDAIGRSVERFAGPVDGAMGQRLFGHSGVDGTDPGRRRAGDLWGEAALAWRAIAGSTSQLRGFVGHLRAILPPPPPAGDVPAAGGALSLPDTLDRYGRFILAGVLVIPALPALATSFWDSVVIRVKEAVIGALARIEAKINGYRKLVLDFVFIDFRRILRKVLSYTISAQIVLIAHVRFFGEFALDYAELVVSELKTWFEAVASYLNKYIGYVNTVLSAVNAVLQFDLGPIIGGVLGTAFGSTLAGPVTALMPSITLDDLITAGTDIARPAVRVALTAYSLALKTLIENAPFIPPSVSGRVDALPSLFWNMLRKPPSFPAETAPIKWPAGYGAPNLYDTIFKPGLPALRQAIDGLARTLPQSAKDILGVGSVALNILGDEFASQAGQIATQTADGRFQRLAETAVRQAQSVFGVDADALRAKIATQPADPVADAFGQWLAYGGFALLGEAIPAYFREMRDFWAEKTARGDEATVRLNMTSPRILAERATLARSHVKQVVIKAAGREVDVPLAQAVAAQFRAAVQQAYSDGQTRLKLYAVSSYV